MENSLSTPLTFRIQCPYRQDPGVCRKGGGRWSQWSQYQKWGVWLKTADMYLTHLKARRPKSFRQAVTN